MPKRDGAPLAALKASVGPSTSRWLEFVVGEFRVRTIKAVLDAGCNIAEADKVAEAVNNAAVRAHAGWMKQAVRDRAFRRV